MTHRLEAAAAAARSGRDQALYDDPGGNERQEGNETRSNSRGRSESIPLRDLSNFDEVDDNNAYLNLDGIQATQVSKLRVLSFYQKLLTFETAQKF